MGRNVQMINSINFLKTITKDRPVLFRCFKANDTRPFDASGSLVDVRTQLEEKNKLGYEIYFLPNSGGYKNKEINSINAVFIDLDCGRDEDHNYFPLSTVQEYKGRKLALIKSFTLTPTAIVETRNGFHAYW